MKDEEKKQILETRKTHQKLSRMILQGTDFRQPMSVRGIDGKTYEIILRPLGEGELLGCFSNSGLDFNEFIEKTGKRCEGCESVDKRCEKCQKEILDYFGKNYNQWMQLRRELVAAAIVDSEQQFAAKDIGELLPFGECTEAATKVMEMSGLLGKPVGAVETFRQQ